MDNHNGVVTLAFVALAACMAQPVLGGQAEGVAGAPSHGWKAMGSMPSTQYEVATVVHEGKLYVFGGFRSGSRATTRCDVFQPSTNTWHRLADMPQAVNHLNAVLVGEGRGSPGPSARARV